jgi:hypothetical protein
VTETHTQLIDRLSAEFERNRIRDYIRETYGVPAEVGQRVAYTYREYRQGTIVGFIDAHLLVTLDGETEPHKYHPTWEMEYLTGPRKIEYCGVCNEEIKPGQPAEFGAPREDAWTGVHLECPQP